jgi:hypothetical protein
MHENKIIFGVIMILTLFASQAIAQQQDPAVTDILEMLNEEKPYHTVTPRQFERLGWDLPDDGMTVKAIADQANKGSFDPRVLENLDSSDIGYRAEWHELRYQHYGLDWDITGLHLVPENPVQDLPALVIMHGGSSNWYEFFVDPLNGPGLGQYLAQRLEVLLVTIPGNYRHGGWSNATLDERAPAYLLDKDLSEEEIRVRNAAYTFQLVADGVKELVQSTLDGAVVMIGHSTAGEIPYILHGSDLRERMHGWILGWGSGGTSSQSAMQDRWGYTQTIDDYPPLDILRPRPVNNYSGDYLGPLNPVWQEGVSREEIARRWMGEQEFQRRPHFKQPLQDIERRGATPGMQQGTVSQVQEVLKGNSYGVDVETVVSDLFSPMRAPTSGYNKIILTTARLDTGHWDKDNPTNASTMQVANEFRELNPGVPVRVLLFDVPMTHYGHVERPRQLAAGLYTALIWLTQ